MVSPRQIILLITGFSLFAEAEEIDFNTDIRPLLSNRCYACHGPDEEERKGDLRLDTREGAMMDLGGYKALVPGDPGESELVYRIALEEGHDDLMPPKGKGAQFNKEEIALIEKWIEQEAPFAQHWSYQKPVRPEVPKGKRSDWPRNAIDWFILARLESEGLSPSPEADRFALARRLSLDLTGLPPTWEEATAFAADESESAYETYVDSLLAKPTFGERWARVWLDLSRYADSAGYADDPPRTIWAFRDYVIRSLNENKPFDQFTIEQIAGDLLENPTEEQLIATAFHRNTMTNSEGGTIDEEWRNAAIVDRVNTTMAVWMGTTIDCAQCHTHKYDPLTHAEYFQLFDFFNQTSDSDKKDEQPVFEIWTEEQEKQKADWTVRIADLKKVVATATDTTRSEQDRWLTRVKNTPHFVSLKPVSAKAKTGKLKIGENSNIQLDGEKADTDVYTVEFAVPDGGIDLRALRLEISEAQKANFVLSQVKAEWKPAGAEKVQPIKFDSVAATHEQSDFPAARSLNEKVNPKLGWGIAGGTGKSQELTLMKRESMPLADGNVTLTLTHQSSYKKSVLVDFAVSVSADGNVAEWAKVPVDLKKSIRDKTADSKRVDSFFLTIAPSLSKDRAGLAKLESQLAAARPKTTVPVMRQLEEEKQRESFVQLRGNYTSHGEKVSAGVPAVFHPLESENPDRLALAEWLVDEGNPLTPRVIANRHWETLFGIGIVETSEEFGSQGELPSHPELLDWLAVELREGGWDLKKFIKLMVMSATYRQSSKTSPELQELDPNNRILARGPRFRVSAEMVRDQVLAVSGLLSDKMFGAPVNPPRPELGLKAAFGGATDWKTSDGEDKFRRGLYTTWRRSSPYPSMATFDAPNREICTVRRDRTNTPLQALVTLNDPVYIEAAQALGRKMDAEGGATTEEKIAFGLRHALVREPNDAEIKLLAELYEDTCEDYATRAADAKTLAEVPIGPLPEGADPINFAAWTVVSNVILNLDEMFMKR